MHKVMNETTSRMRGLISRRMFSQAGIAALSAKLLPRTDGCLRRLACCNDRRLVPPRLLERRSSLSTENPGCRLRGCICAGALSMVQSGWTVTRRVRIAQRQGCMRECTGGGAFAETVVCTLFGYLPKFGGTPELLNTDTPRGFTGELRHVCCGVQRYTIQSRETRLMLEIES
jgi:hypothetical protein